MKLPHLTRAYIPPHKLTDYLLAEHHEQGGPKAAFFIRFGFLPEAPEVLAAALMQHVRAHPVARQETTRFGTRYVIEGMLDTPIGRRPWVRSVWFIPWGDDQPHLVTAYAMEAEA